MKWTIDYYSKKVADSITKLPKKLVARYFRVTEVMLEYGADLGMPHTRSLEVGCLNCA